jgi:hypothetical protein
LPTKLPTKKIAPKKGEAAKKSADQENEATMTLNNKAIIKNISNFADDLRAVATLAETAMRWSQ